MEAFVYTRKSRALGDPDDDPFLLAHQREALLRLAAQLELPVGQVVEEIGSGEHLETRPRFASLLEQWRREPPAPGTVLMVIGIERISRADPELSGQIVGALIRAGVIVQTLSQRFDLTKPDDLMLFTVLLAVGHHGVNRYRQDAQLRKEELRRNGELVTGAACYGYRWDKNSAETEPGQRRRGRLVPIPEEFAVVQKLFAEVSTKSIVRLSEETGLPQSKIRYILRNPVYTGYPARHCRQVTKPNNKRSSRPIPEGPQDWPERAGRYPPAVTRQQFEAAQAAIRDRFSRKDKTGSENGWCRDLLEVEGGPVHVKLGSQHWHRRNVPVYILQPSGGGPLCFPREPIHEAARMKVVAALENPVSLVAAITAAEARLASTVDPAHRRGNIAADLARARQRLVALKLEAADADPEDRRALRTAEEQVKGQIDALRRQLQEIDQAPPPNPYAGMSELLERSRHAGVGAALWEELSEEERRAIANDLLERIVLRITPAPGGRASRREIVAVDYTEWYQPFAEGSAEREGSS